MSGIVGYAFVFTITYSVNVDVVCSGEIQIGSSKTEKRRGSKLLD